jgi:hypothetical protein
MGVEWMLVNFRGIVTGGGDTELTAGPFQRTRVEKRFRYSKGTKEMGNNKKMYNNNSNNNQIK